MIREWPLGTPCQMVCKDCGETLPINARYHRCDLRASGTVLHHVPRPDWPTPQEQANDLAIASLGRTPPL